jgi:adenosylcobinamide kinase / adenosylcobinamide-phosphate guanylyltransferase
MNKEPGHITLIIGGGRSGKSSYAQQLAVALGDCVLFVATAEARDEEMVARIAAHQEERPPGWRTLEEPYHIAQALESVAPAPVVVLDCVTLWVSNLLLQEGATWEHAIAELDALLAWHQAHPCELIIVSNEVGWGIVPADELTRTYRDWLGRFNQRIAACASSVYLMVAGVAVVIKEHSEKGNQYGGVFSTVRGGAGDGRESPPQPATQGE